MMLSIMGLNLHSDMEDVLQCYNVTQGEKASNHLEIIA